MQHSTTQMEEYLSELPHGLDSYPEYVQKASVYRKVFTPKLTEKFAPLLPDKLRQLLAEPLPVTAWIPEVFGNALLLVLFENHFLDESRWIAEALETARALFLGPMYRSMMMLLSPELIIQRAPSRWEALHRGIELSASISTESVASLRLRFPPRLVPRVVALVYGPAFQAALEAAGARDARCVLAESASEEAVYEATWRTRATTIPPPRSSGRSF